MNIKRNLTILMVSLVLSVPVMSLKNEYQPADAQPQANFEIQLATVAEAEEQKKILDDQKAAEELAAAQAAEAQRVAAQEAAQAAEAEKQRIAAEEAQKAAVAAAEAANCGPADPAVVYGVLRELGLSRTAAVQMTGSWKHESGLDPCQKRGDGGEAWGLNSWHPNRRVDMPENLRAQIVWAITVELPRDCPECYQIIVQSPNAGVTTVRAAIQKTTRWGVLGNRWVYADELNSILP
jgi:hypothetical protein